MTLTTLTPSIADRGQSRRIMPRVNLGLPRNTASVSEAVSSSGLVAQLEIVRRICDRLTMRVDVQAVFYRESQESRAHRVIPVKDAPELVSLGRVLDAACRAAQQSGKLDVQQQIAPDRTLLAIPIDKTDGQRSAIGMSIAGEFSKATLHWIGEALANAYSFEAGKSRELELEREVAETTAVIDLIEDAMRASDVRNACQRLIAKLQTVAPTSRIAMGYRQGHRKTCRLLAISGHAKFDRQSHLSTSLESLMTELIERNSPVTWSIMDDVTSLESAPHVAAALGSKCQRIFGMPISFRGGESTAALVLLGEETDFNTPRTIAFLQAAEPSIACVLNAAGRNERSYAARAIRSFGDSWTGLEKIAIAGLMLVIGIVLCIPMTYKIACPSLVEPIHRRYVAAPFDGTLERALVKPGEHVLKGELIARMDDREIRWKRASVLADQNQAQKKRDAAQAGHSYADQQLAQLEFDRLQIELQMLDDRAANLEITSPIDGIVTSGDLARVEGAPLSVGQTLFEIAPTDQMIAEVSIVDHEIAYVKEEQIVDIHFDAYPRSSWKAKIVKIRPRAEIRDNLNVFVAEVELDNADKRLRPGMKGRAKIHADKRAYGWILFHQPFEYITPILAW